MQDSPEREMGWHVQESAFCRLTVLGSIEGSGCDLHVPSQRHLEKWGWCAQARQATAASLKCWVVNATWTPELMPVLFAPCKSITGEPALVTLQVQSS